MFYNKYCDNLIDECRFKKQQGGHWNCSVSDTANCGEVGDKEKAIGLRNLRAAVCRGDPFCLYCMCIKAHTHT